MTKQNETIDEIMEHNARLRSSTRINEAGARTVAEVLDTMRKHPKSKMDDILRNMR